jgi:hypothetical protein
MKETYKLDPEGGLYVTEIPSGSGRQYGFKKWTWGEKNALTAECVIMNPVAGFTNMDVTKFNEQLVVRTAFKKIDGKFDPITVDELRAMDAQLGERLSRITQSINLISDIEAQNL